VDEEPIHANSDSAEAAGSPSATSTISEPRFVSVKPKGVGGWLLFFVIGQLVLRPVQFFGARANGVDLAQIAARFPSTARIIVIERALLIGSMIAGIIVGLALLKTGDKWPVLLTRLYLIASPLLAILLAVLYTNSDLPQTSRSQVITSGIVNAAGTCVVCLVWFLYFTKSKRVQATYLGRAIQHVQ
jgi:hypothetical protein